MAPLMELSPAARAKARMVFTCWFLEVEELAVEIAPEILKKEKEGKMEQSTNSIPVVIE